MPAFWKSSGMHLLERDRNGWLVITPDFLRAYYTRPEIHPVEESCKTEHTLFERLMGDPFATVCDSEIAAIRDKDAVENYRLLLAFRDHLVEHGSVEAAYAALFSSAASLSLPPVFLDQLVHLVVHNMLRKIADPMRARAGELFFREQVVTTGDGQLVLADAEIVETWSRTGGFGGLGALLAEAGTPLKDVSLDVLGEENRDLYWERSDRFDTAIDFRFTEPALDAFARVLETWTAHFHGVQVRIQPQQSIRDERWSWHVGLDVEATAILNALYEGKMLDEGALSRIIALFRLDFETRGDVIDTMRGKPVWLALAMGQDGKLRMKPQNLLTNLPLRRRN